MTKKEYNELFSNPSWDFETIQAADDVCGKIAKKYLKLDIYPNQIEIITSEQMLDAYALIGLPTCYPHWKFGKDFSINHSKYHQGRMGLAYEMVINSNPCISYNMENNSTMMMVLVIAHAAYGHNSFFKNNYLFQQWTDAEAIIDYMVFAREYVLKCEEKYGPEEVELTLDACHALMNYGVDKYKKPRKLSLKKEKERQAKNKKHKRENYNELWKTLPEKEVEEAEEFELSLRGKKGILKRPEENILYFIEKNAPTLPEWKKEIVRIVRRISQYFYPQEQTKVMNEGWASFCHYNIINNLHEEGYVGDGFMLEFIRSHTAVLYQLDYKSKYYSGINPYTLGYNIFTDIKRICEAPTKEDKEWFPDLAGGNWLKEITWAMQNFRDDSFILQYLSPKVIRDMKLFTLEDRETRSKIKVDSIHNKRGYKRIRESLANQYSRSFRVPDIQIEQVDLYKDRKMILRHIAHDEIGLDKKEAEQTMEHLNYLWGFPVILYSETPDGETIEIIKMK